MTKSHITQLTLTQPDDWHLHLRDNAALKRTVADYYAEFTATRYHNRISHRIS